ncbi:hypothetical protein Csa_009673 [Cucumis sativus]|uniref:Uncharacterized protein n=1 Tax=Cucumis sativus TaxID=3659 RepID=A0A0A0L8E7_CUCSA|nr:hypothetical protein Csa_009673 [Cucumis sativus]
MKNPDNEIGKKGERSHSGSLESHTSEVRDSEGTRIGILVVSESFVFLRRRGLEDGWAKLEAESSIYLNVVVFFPCEYFISSPVPENMENQSCVKHHIVRSFHSGLCLQKKTRKFAKLAPAIEDSASNLAHPPSSPRRFSPEPLPLLHTKARIEKTHSKISNAPLILPLLSEVPKRTKGNQPRYRNAKDSLTTKIPILVPSESLTSLVILCLSNLFVE